MFWGLREHNVYIAKEIELSGGYAMHSQLMPDYVGIWERPLRRSAISPLMVWLRWPLSRQGRRLPSLRMFQLCLASWWHLRELQVAWLYSWDSLLLHYMRAKVGGKSWCVPNNLSITFHLIYWIGNTFALLKKIYTKLCIEKSHSCFCPLSALSSPTALE